MFSGGGRRGFGAPAALPVYKYKLEVSQDGEKFQTVLDKTKNAISKDTLYDEFKPVNCRFVEGNSSDLSLC